MFPLNLPNVLTVLRIMLVPVLVAALLGNTPSGDVLAAVVFALASLTDFVDGYLARARGSITTFGKLMDPLADKLLIIAALLALVSLNRLPAWIAMVIITRELAVTVLRMGATQAGVVRTFPSLDGASFVSARQENRETIHQHNVLAERHSLLAELRGELESGAPTARQTTLEQWLDGGSGA